MDVIITGATGRMGKMNIKTIGENKECRLVGAIDIPGSEWIGKDAGICAGIAPMGIHVTERLDQIKVKADVILDFTVPGAIKVNLDYAVKTKTAIVIGTTGIEPEHHRIMKEASQSIPVIWAPNFSVGINLLNYLTRFAGEILKRDFDPEIIESHHRMKTDAPSGTAKLLLNTLKQVYQTDDTVFGREGIPGERPLNQIGVHAIRGGDIVGEHTVLFAGIGERIELTHKASTRETFSRGALRAAQYIVKQTPGLYSMSDVLGF